MATVRIINSASPVVSLNEAAQLCSEIFGITGHPRELGSQQDRNVGIDAADARYVLKIANPEWRLDELAAQNAALEHLRSADCPVLTPQAQPVLPASMSTPVGTIAEIDHHGQQLHVRLLSYLSGSSLTDTPYLAPTVRHALGTVSAQVNGALRDFHHPGLDRDLQWDLRRAHSVIGKLAAHVKDPRRRKLVLTASDSAARVLDAVTSGLRTQAIHGDITDDNVVAQRDLSQRLIPHGVIDFGDVAYGWLISELAVTATSLLHHDLAEPLDILPAARAFHGLVELNEAEVSALWPLIVLRAATLVVNGAMQASLDPQNKYVSDALEREWLMFQRAVEVPYELGEAAIRDSLGLARSPKSVRAVRALHSFRPVFSAGGPHRRTIDLSLTSDALVDGNWLTPDLVEALLSEGAAPDCRPSTAYGEYRLTETRADAAMPPATFALAVSIQLQPNVDIYAPFAATLTAAADSNDAWLLEGKDVDLRLDGLVISEPPPMVGAGDRLGSSKAAGGALTVQAMLPGLSALRPPTSPSMPAPTRWPPALVTATSARAWMELCPDPSPLLQPAAPDPAAPDPAAPEPAAPEPAAPEEPPTQRTAADLLEQRHAWLAPVQEHYYANPPQLERGWRHHLIDTHGRTYLDMMNNVTILGHADPEFVAELTNQWSLLNTNSRFHYAALAELSQRLAARCPAGLDTVFFVNSGSEAVDLALRLAMVHTSRADVVSVQEAYHGWTMASDAISTSAADNPNALQTRPDWAHTVLAPNSFRGRYRGSDSAPAYIAQVAQRLDELQTAGRPIAAFIAESFYGNAGGVALPPGYLTGVYAAVRSHGGLCIADEVQVGYGRLGDYFWGFQQQDVTPDIITVAKSMGNGQPLGAVITSRAIADSFSSQGSFFSSAGGSPVSCRAGLAVLEILDKRGLQENARTVGQHLRNRLVAVASRHPIIGAVHGMGLYLGVEIVRDKTSLQPGAPETAAICERLLELGVMVQPTGDQRNVLKIKPPMCMSLASADFFADCLEEVLTQGW